MTNKTRPDKHAAKIAAATPADYITTSEAADMLGVSVGTVLNMVERQQLLAWRTEGGHRRINFASVMARISARSSEPEEAVSKPALLDILVIEDEELLLDMYREHFDDWKLPVRLRLVANGVDGLMEIGRQKPDLLLLDLMLPQIDGFAVLRELRAKRHHDTMDIIAITGLDTAGIAAGGGMPAGVVVWQKPIPFHQLHGFIDARLTSMALGRN
jgi:excisionase family DNA binding protein